MSGDSTEEKNLPPTQRKLQNLRRKGQIARSQDAVQVVAIVAVLAYLVFFFGDNMARLRGLFLVTGWGVGGGGFINQLGSVVSASIKLTIEILLPIIGIVIVAVIVTTGFDGKGFPISGESIAPKFNKLNPAEGVKKVFNLRNLMQFIKGIIEVTLVVIGNYIVFRYFLNPILWAPTCQEACLAKVAILSILAVIFVGLIIIIIGAVVDLPMSRWLFKRENKMSHSEMKREMKEDYGSPEIRQARKQRQQQMAAGAGFIGIGKANLLFAAGDYAVGIVYDAEKTPAPMIVAKGAGTVALEYRSSVAARGVTVVEDGEMVTALMERGQIGEFVPEDTFVAVARALISAGIIKM